MKIQPLLRRVHFGGAVAEHESQLSRYFVETSSFWEVVDDRADVILGPKGAGKSAITRRLVESPPVAGLDDVDVIAAFNLQGSVIFRRLATELNKVDEAQMRTVWTIYILSLIGNHIVREYGTIGLAGDVHVILKDAGLLVEGPGPKGLWSLVLSAIRRMQPSRMEASLTVTDTGLPIATGSLDLVEKAERGSSPIDWEMLLQAEIAVFEFHERRCWLVFDRLDEAFPHDRGLERVALRALLRTHIDICSFGSTLRTKLFLRTDLLDRLTLDEGFVNATHFRKHAIRWSHASLVDLVARRILEVQEIRRAFNFTQEQANNQDGRWQACLSVVPEDIAGHNADAFAWMVDRSTDASDEPNPRNILTLLTEARSSQLQICDRDDPDFEEVGSLISRKALQDGYRGLSKTRLEDTLLAEFNHLRPHIDKLRGRPFAYYPEQLARHLLLDDSPDDFERLVADFRYSGFMRQSPNGRLSVPLLYRSALRMTEGASRSREPIGPSPAAPRPKPPFAPTFRSVESQEELPRRRRRRPRPGRRPDGSSRGEGGGGP